ncbi:hypothetical protein Tco_1059205 [Tanacetum coccineum]
MLLYPRWAKRSMKPTIRIQQFVSEWVALDIQGLYKVLVQRREGVRVDFLHMVRDEMNPVATKSIDVNSRSGSDGTGMNKTLFYLGFHKKLLWIKTSGSNLDFCVFLTAGNRMEATIDDVAINWLDFRHEYNGNSINIVGFISRDIATVMKLGFKECMGLM